MKSELMDSWILHNLYNSYEYISSQTLRVLQASKIDISLLSFLILLPSVEAASPAQSAHESLLWNYMVDWLIMAGSNQLTSLWISFLLRWWRTRAPWQKAQRVCLPSTVTSSTSKPFRDLDTFHYINPWTCFFNFETVYICECHIFTNAKLAQLEVVSSIRDRDLYHTYLQPCCFRISSQSFCRKMAAS